MAKPSAREFAGRQVWPVLHIFAASFEPNQYTKHAFRLFLYTVLPNLFPCAQCRQHLIQNLKNFPLTDDHMRSNESLFHYTYMLHDIVNGQLGKKSPPYQQVRRYYFMNLGDECLQCKIPA